MPKNDPDVVLYDTQAIARMALDAVIKGRMDVLDTLLADLNTAEQDEVEGYLREALTLVTR